MREIFREEGVVELDAKARTASRLVGHGSALAVRRQNAVFGDQRLELLGRGSSAAVFRHARRIGGSERESPVGSAVLDHVLALDVAAERHMRWCCHGTHDARTFFGSQAPRLRREQSTVCPAWDETPSRPRLSIKSPAYASGDGAVDRRHRREADRARLGARRPWAAGGLEQEPSSAGPVALAWGRMVEIRIGVRVVAVKTTCHRAVRKAREGAGGEGDVTDRGYAPVLQENPTCPQDDPSTAGVQRPESRISTGIGAQPEHTTSGRPHGGTDER